MLTTPGQILVNEALPPEFRTPFGRRVGLPLLGLGILGGAGAGAYAMSK